MFHLRVDLPGCAMGGTWDYLDYMCIIYIYNHIYIYLFIYLICLYLYFIFIFIFTFEFMFMLIFRFQCSIFTPAHASEGFASCGFSTTHLVFRYLSFGSTFFHLFQTKDHLNKQTLRCDMRHST